MQPLLPPGRWRVTTSRSRRLAIAAVIIFVLLGALDLLSYSTLARVTRRAIASQRGYRELNLAQRTLESLQRMESVYREFLLTGREAALGRYEPARAAYSFALEQLIVSSADRPDEQRLWKRVAERATAWQMEVVQPAVALRRAVVEGQASYQQLVLAESFGSSGMYFDEMRALLAEATRSQRGAMAEQGAEDGLLMERVRTATLFGTAILVVLGVLIAIMTTRLQVALGELSDADAAKARSDEQLQSVVASVREVIFRTDARGRWLVLTPGWTTLTGLAIEDTLGRSFTERMHVGDRARVLATFAEFRKSASDELRDEFRIDGAAGERWLDVHARAERDSAGRLIAVDGTLADVTERRALEGRLRQAMKMEAMGQLAGGVAHDFNNILAVILTSAELAGHAIGAQPVSAVRDIREIKFATKRAAALTRQLLAFSSRQPRAPVVLDLNERLRDCETLLSRLLPPSVALEFTLDEREPAILIDPSDLEQVVINLVVNARDAMRDGGTVHVESLVVGDRVKLSVSDEGIGMDAATQQRMFEPFFTTKPMGKGTGLGLATVHGIVESAGALIDVSSTVGSGTTFMITFATVGGVAVTTSEYAVAPEMGRGRVLLVDDEAGVRDSAARTLRRYGYEVFEACHGTDALRIIEDRKDIELVLTDLLMPQMGGRELQLRLRKRYPELPVVFMTGYGAGEIELTDRTSILEKPFTSSALVEHIQRALAG